MGPQHDGWGRLNLLPAPPSSMHVLGLSDGRDAAAAVIVAGGAEVVVQARPGLVGLPWEAAAEAVDRAGLTPEDIDVVALAGRFTPPLSARRIPALRRLARDPFSPLRSVAVVWQHAMRRSGLGVVEDDRASAWLLGESRRRGYAPSRVRMVDIHHALATAAYRFDGGDDLTIVVAHPLGDGTLLSVHQGDGGHLDRVSSQRGGPRLHLFLERCAAGLDVDLRDPERWSEVASRGHPPDRLRAQLERAFYAEGRRLHADDDAPVDALGDVDVADGAAAVLGVVRRALVDVVRAVAGPADVRLAGALAQDPRLIGDLAGVPGRGTVSRLPLPVHASLALGAAAAVAGRAPHPLDPGGFGRTVGEEDARRAALGAGLKPGRRKATATWLRDRLAGGMIVGRLVDRGGHGWAGGGRHALLVRADRVERVAEARAGLGRSADDPLLTLIPARLASRFDPRLSPALDAGVAAVAPPADLGLATSADGRARLKVVQASDDADLAAALDAVGPVVAIPLAPGEETPVVSPDVALRTAIRAGADAMALGPLALELVAP